MCTIGTGEQERYTTCIGIVQNILPIALARPYSKYVLPEGTKVSQYTERIGRQLNFIGVGVKRTFAEI